MFQSWVQKFVDSEEFYGFKCFLTTSFSKLPLQFVLITSPMLCFHINLQN